jgi:adenylyltransferase/sulfurtransferase
VSVFNYQNGPSYHDLFPSAPEAGMVDNCDINGVLGPVAGLIGNLMAIEALKVLTGIGKVLSGELLVLQLDDFSSVKMKIPKKSLPLDLGKKELVYHSISSFDLKKALHEKEKLQLIDVRIPEQYQEKHIKGSINIPYDEILSRLNEISRDREVVMICNIGQASMNVIRYLQNELNYTNLINLDGGVYAYFNE